MTPFLFALFIITLTLQSAHAATDLNNENDELYCITELSTVFRAPLANHLCKKICIPNAKGDRKKVERCVKSMMKQNKKITDA